MTTTRRFMVVHGHRGGKLFYWQPTVSEWFADQDKGKVYKQRAAADRAAETWGGEVIEVMHVEPPAPPEDKANALTSVSSAIAAKIIQKALDAGKTIEIPSLGIVLKKEDGE
jgi:hypothetical protein